MRFPNGFKGVSKVFTAEILSLIASVILAIFGGVTLGVGVAAGATGEVTDAAIASVGILGILSLATPILLILALIFKLIGLSQAGKDEENFKSAFIVAIFVLILAVVSAILSAVVGQNGVVDDIVTLVQRIGDIVIIFLVIGGIQNFAVRLSDEAMLNRGTSVAWVIAIPYLLAAIANLIRSLFITSDAVNTISGILAIVAGILGIVGSILYLVYLGKGRKMLKEEN